MTDDTPDPDETVEEFDRSAWVATDHERVFYKTPSDKFDRGEYALGKWIADHIPGWTVLITMGPYRFAHDIAYELHPAEKVIHIDCYSAAFAVYGEDIGYRQKHPAVEWAESAIHEIAEGIKRSKEEGLLDEPFDGEGRDE